MSLFLTRQTCIQSDFTMVRLEPGVKLKFSTGIEPTISRSVDVCPLFYQCHPDCRNFHFCAVNIRLKEANFKRESEQNILHWRLAFNIAQYRFILGVLYGHELFSPF